MNKEKKAIKNNKRSFCRNTAPRACVNITHLGRMSALLYLQKAFTLIELLVVVLIIGILAAIAIPQYQKAVEKARLTEAIVNLRVIAHANKVYFMTNGVYAEPGEIDKLGVDIPGSINTEVGGNRIATQYFIYSPKGNSCADCIGVAWRAKNGIVDTTSSYSLAILLNGKIRCTSYAKTPSIEKGLCAQVNTNGGL